MGIGMVDWLKQWLETDNTKLIYVLVLILMSNVIDFTFGWINAKFNKAVCFSSTKAIMGIARKMVMFILCVMFIPIALLVPEPIGIGALYVLFLGYLASEINSILSHLKMTADGKQEDMFIDFVEKILPTKEDENK